MWESELTSLSLNIFHVEVLFTIKEKKYRNGVGTIFGETQIMPKDWVRYFVRLCFNAILIKGKKGFHRSFGGCKLFHSLVSYLQPNKSGAESLPRTWYGALSWSSKREFGVKHFAITGPFGQNCVSLKPNWPSSFWRWLDYITDSEVSTSMTLVEWEIN